MLCVGTPVLAQDAAAPPSDITVQTLPNEGEEDVSSGMPEKTAAPADTVKTPAPAESAPTFNAIRLRGLNKVTARNSMLEAPLGTIMRFGNLEIIARKCWQAPPEDRPETAALLEIRELKPGEGAPHTVFLGWMFASSPALSALEHPVYDITVLNCANVKEE